MASLEANYTISNPQEFYSERFLNHIVATASYLISSIYLLWSYNVLVPANRRKECFKVPVFSNYPRIDPS